MANKYFKKTAIPSAGVETTIYTVPSANSAVLRSLRVTNAGALATSITVTQYTGGVAPEHYLLRGKTLPVNATIDVFNGVPCVLEASDVLKVTSTEGSVVFYLSYMEMDRN
jgi:hypothetical protein